MKFQDIAKCTGTAHSSFQCLGAQSKTSIGRFPLLTPRTMETIYPSSSSLSMQHLIHHWQSDITTLVGGQEEDRALISEFFGQIAWICPRHTLPQIRN